MLEAWQLKCGEEMERLQMGYRCTCGNSFFSLNPEAIEESLDKLLSCLEKNGATVDDVYAGKDGINVFGRLQS